MRRLFVILLLLFSIPAKATLEITISGGQTAATPIAIVPFSKPPEITQDIASVVEADLVRSGLFSALRRSDMLEQPSETARIDYRNWRTVNVDYVVVGQVRRSSAERLVTAFQLVDVVRAEQMMGYNVPVPDASRMRPVAHQIADLIYEKLTGIPGYFNSQIAYVEASGPASRRVYQLVVADFDGANAIVIARSPEPLMSPAWSPDRRQLAYVGFDHGRSAIYIHTLTTGQLRKLVAERGINGAPAWSPDGRSLAVTMSFESNPDIYVLDVATGARRRLTDHFAIDTEPTWSPDGREIAFTSDRGGQPQIYVSSANGGDAKRVTFEGKQNLRPRYSPDGKSLALVNLDDMGYRIGLLDLKTRALRILSDGPLDESPSFAPNGAVVIYASQGRQGAELATVTTDGRFKQRLSEPGDVREPAWSPNAR